MPYIARTVRAEKFMQFRKTVVYHTYRNDDVDQGRREYWFTLDPRGSECDENAFDVRSLKCAHLYDTETEEGKKGTIQEALANGELKRK